MRNDTGDNVSIASSMTAATNYRNSDSRPMSGNRLVQYFPPPSINRYQSSLFTMNNHSRPISSSSSSSSFISRPTNLWIIIDEVLSIFIFFKHHVLSHQHLQDSLVEFQDSISPTIIIIIIYNYYYHHHYYKSYKHIYGYQICII